MAAAKARKAAKVASATTADDDDPVAKAIAAAKARKAARDALAAERKRHEQTLAALFQKTCAELSAAMEDVNAKQAAIEKKKRDAKKKMTKDVAALMSMIGGSDALDY